MNSHVESLHCQIDRFSKLIGKAVSWLTFVMVLTMTLVVVLRYGFDMGWIWMQESILYLHAFTIALAMSHTLLLDEHVRVDIFYRRKSANKKGKINVFGHIFFLFPTCLFILFKSWDYVAQSWAIGEASQEAGGLPFLYILKTTLIIMPLMLIFQGVSEILKELTSQTGEQH